MAKEKKKCTYTQNRELSWLKFNERVLEEADDKDVPLLERLSFSSIFISNLDEFFMIRVGSLFDLSLAEKYVIDTKTGMTPKEQLDKIYEAVKPLYTKKDNIHFQLENKMRFFGICSLSIEELTLVEKEYIKDYFYNQILPILSPQIVDKLHPFPYFNNKLIHIVAMLKNKNNSVLGIVPIPATLPEIVFLPGDGIRYIHTEKIILEYVQEVFDMYNVTEKNYICVTRNADISADDEAFDIDNDFRYLMQRLLSKRKKMAVVRLEAAYPMSKKFEEFLCDKFSINKKQIFYVKSPMKIHYIGDIKNRLSLELKMNLTYPKFKPQLPIAIDNNESIVEQINKKDLLLSYPFESMKPFLNLLKEAANDPDVVSIKMCIYRLSKNSRLIEYLCMAAENGKDVTVLIELRARFDEQNNIDWSERLEEAGCKIMYGFEGFKVHSKICLITRKEQQDISYITYIGTGNFNEKTAELYTDLALITADREIGMDAVNFFKNMAISNLNGTYKQLLVSPYELKNRVIALIKSEARKKENGSIIIKMNSITDIDIIHELAKASAAGVKIHLIIRGICCIIPGVEKYTENITVTSIVGRFLEHSRIYSFGTGEDQKIYISSADFMTRNTEKRVEIACPINDEELKNRINHIIDVILSDNLKARELQSDCNYKKIENDKPLISSQDVFMQEAIECNYREE